VGFASSTASATSSPQALWLAGGMAMNDKGVTTYYEEINQMSHGAAFLQNQLGYNPADPHNEVEVDQLSNL